MTGSNDLHTRLDNINTRTFRAELVAVALFVVMVAVCVAVGGM